MYVRNFDEATVDDAHSKRMRIELDFTDYFEPQAALNTAFCAQHHVS